MYVTNPMYLDACIDLVGGFEFKTQRLNKQEANIMKTFVFNSLWHKLIETRCFIVLRT